MCDSSSALIDQSWALKADLWIHVFVCDSAEQSWALTEQSLALTEQSWTLKAEL